MALIRVSGHIEVPGETLTERDIIINTSHIVYARPGDDDGKNFSILHIVDGETIRVDMPFEEVWMLIQRET